MYSKLQLAFKYIRYWFTASNAKGHGIHSPFVYYFVRDILNDRRSFYCYENIEALRGELRKNNNILTVEDFGAGSHTNLFKKRSIASIATSALKPKKFSQLLFRMVNYYQPATVLELGTSLGITTSYLASAKSDATVVTMEGAPQIAVVAKQNFEKLHLNNAKLVIGNFDMTLPEVMMKMSNIDFAFIDGNHRKEPTLSYFTLLQQRIHEHSVIVFDDIHWSKEMEEAWSIIQQSEAVTLSIDLFFIGIVFFRKENKAKQHFVIRF